MSWQLGKFAHHDSQSKVKGKANRFVLSNLFHSF